MNFCAWCLRPARMHIYFYSPQSLPTNHFSPYSLQNESKVLANVRIPSWFGAWSGTRRGSNRVFLMRINFNLAMARLYGDRPNMYREWQHWIIYFTYRLHRVSREQQTIGCRRVLSALHAKLIFAICRQRSPHASVQLQTIGRIRLCGCNEAYAVHRKTEVFCEVHQHVLCLFGKLHHTPLV